MKKFTIVILPTFKFSCNFINIGIPSNGIYILQISQDQLVFPTFSVYFCVT